tara:strand:+ start:520 stop:1395 length:876 start_codon:yes stop_codon:yes gene_type:complete
MIKLFWNTHNQKNNPNDKEDKDFIWGEYHKDNSNKWIYEILNKVEFKIIDTDKDIDNKDTLIIIDSSVEKKSEFYAKLKLLCSKIFLIHLGDETGAYDLSSVYQNCDHVWRTFCSGRYFKNKKVDCIAIGYKSGVEINKKDNERKYKWAFIGTPHRSSRHDLLFQFSSIKPCFSYKTEKFNQKIMNVKEMTQILSQTKFIPCPNGFVHPETYRVYEALECGSIPIVENAYKYYDRLFPNNPFLKVDRWVEAKEIINKWTEQKINQKSEECNLWWLKYKKKLQDNIKEKIMT